MSCKKEIEYYSLGACFTPGRNKSLTLTRIEDIIAEIGEVKRLTLSDIETHEKTKPPTPNVYDRDAYLRYMDVKREWLVRRDALNTRLDIINIDLERADQVRRLGSNFTRVARAS